MKNVMNEIANSLGRGIRLIGFRRNPLDVPDPHPACLVVLFALNLIGIITLDWLVTGESAELNEYGLSALFASGGIFALALFMINPSSGQPSFLRSYVDITSVSIMLALPFIAIIGGSTLVLPLLGLSQVIAAVVQGALWLLIFIWWFGALIWTGRVLWGGQLRMPGTRLLVLALLPVIFVPNQPIVVSDNTDWSRSDVWYYTRQANKYFASNSSEREARPPVKRLDVEATYYRQPQLVKAALD